MFAQCAFYFLVSRQRRAFGYPEAFGCFAFGQQKIIDAVLRHDARRLPGQDQAEIIVAGLSPSHGDFSGVCGFADC